MSDSFFPHRVPIREAAALTAASYYRILGANDKIQLGVIGCGERGRHDMLQLMTVPLVNVAAVCDIYGERIDQARSIAPNAKNFTDHRKLLEMKEIDAVLIATPDHWHSRIAIDALTAGKDVYVETPLTLKIEEGPPIVEVARRNTCICQVGMQQRSGKHYLQAKREYIDSGKLGTLTMARTWWHGNTDHLRLAPASLQTKPSNLDWSRYLGSVKWRDYDPQQYYNFRAYLDFGGGQVTDLFTHWIDVVHLFTGKDIPSSAVSTGSVSYHKDGRTAPDRIEILLEYPSEFTATFEATLAPGITGAAVEICGTEGRLWIDRRRYEYCPVGHKVRRTIVKAEGCRLPGVDQLTLDHIKNFLECARSRKLPNGDVLIGHRSVQASHLGNLAYEQMRRLAFDTVRERVLPL